MEICKGNIYDFPGEDAVVCVLHVGTPLTKKAMLTEIIQYCNFNGLDLEEQMEEQWVHYSYIDGDSKEYNTGSLPLLVFMDEVVERYEEV